MPKRKVIVIVHHGPAPFRKVAISIQVHGQYQTMKAALKLPPYRISRWNCEKVIKKLKNGRPQEIDLRDAEQLIIQQFSI